MSTRLMRRKRQEKTLSVLMITSFAAFIVTVVLLVGHAGVKYKIESSEKSVEALSKEVTTLQEQIEEIKKMQDESKDQLDALQSQINKYDESIVARFSKEESNN